MKKLLIISSFVLFFNFLYTESLTLPSITSYIDATVVEQRQIITEEEIDCMNVADLPALLEAAGIQILSYGPYGLEQKPSIRGFTDETVRVIINGVCVNNAQYGTFDFSTLNIKDIEKIEIIRGGFTEGVSDEGAVGGAIYITTKKQVLGHHFDFDSGIKSFFNYYYPLDSFFQSAGYSGQISDAQFLKVNLKGTFANNKYLFTNYKGIKSQRDNARVIDGNGNINYSYFFDGNYINISDFFYAGNKQTPGTETSFSYGVQKDYDNNLTIQLVNPEVGKGIKLENTLSWLSNTRFYNDKTSDSAHFVNTGKYAGSVYLHKLDWFKESAGITLDYTYLDSTDDGIHQQFSGALKSTSKFFWCGNGENWDNGDRPPLNGEQKNNRDNRDRPQFAFTLPLSLKFSNKNLAFTPKLGFSINTKHVDLLIDGYRMTQFPNMDDLYWESSGYKGNPDLIPESGWGGDFTVNVHNIWLPFSLCAYINFYENKIQWANLGGNWRPENVASAFYFGIDGRLEKNFWNDRISVTANGEYLHTSLLDKRNSMTYGKKIMWTPDFTGSASIRLNFPGKGKTESYVLLAEANYMGKRYTTNANISYVKPYTLINLSAQMTVASKNWHFTPYIRLENLLNMDYEAVDAYPMPGISGTVGLKIKR